MNQIFAWILALFLPLSGAQSQEVTIPTSASLPDWGITVCAEDIRPTGLTLSIHQSGGQPTGQLQFGSDYILERLEKGTWQPVPPTVQGEIAWDSLAYLVTMDGECQQEILWEPLYGSLSSGTYRIRKNFQDFRDTGDFDTQTLSLVFEIE